jgi:hypothetical protein
LFSPWYSWKIVHLTLSNYQSRTHFLFYIAHFMVIHSYMILILKLRATITEIYVVLQAVFQQLLHTEDISLTWCDIPNLVVTMMTSLKEGCCKQRRYWTKGSKYLKLKSSLRKFYGRHHDFAIVTEYPCHKWPRICSVCRNQNLVFYSIMTCGPGTAYHSVSPEFISVFSVVRFVQSLVFYAYHCLSLCTFLSAIVLSCIYS